MGGYCENFPLLGILEQFGIYPRKCVQANSKTK